MSNLRQDKRIITTHCEPAKQQRSKLVATGKLERTYCRVPVEGASLFLIFGRIPEIAIVGWIYGYGAIVAPASQSIATHIPLGIKDRIVRSVAHGTLALSIG